MASGAGAGSETRSGDLATTATEVGRVSPARPGIGGSVLSNRRLAHFRLERELGKGGMGEVWLATDLALERPVAIKLLSRELSADPSLRERFYREARAQARIQHPNVGHIYYIGEEDGQLFFAMEYIEGESVLERLKQRGALPPHEAIDICRQAALGLREAARVGFTHRDVKPSNLMIDRHGTVKLTDFGLVKASGGPTVGVQLTQDAGAGAVLGTPLYMAPEQARGDAVDLRTDIYALGATLHHLIAGEPPFSGETALQVVSKHLSAPRPPVPGERKEFPALDSLLDRMMAKEPADRFASYDDLLTAFEQTAPGGAAPAGFFVRAFAVALDAIILSMTVLPLGGLLGEPWSDLFVWTLCSYYTIAAHARFGRTLGKWALDIVVEPEGRRGRLGHWQAAQRYGLQWGPFVVAVGGFELSSVLWDGRFAGSRVVLLVLLVLLAVVVLVGGVAAGFRRDRRAYWDRLSGTRVRYARRG
jgi:hypothetical protein